MGRRSCILILILLILFNLGCVGQIPACNPPEPEIRNDATVVPYDSFVLLKSDALVRKNDCKDGPECITSADLTFGSGFIVGRSKADPHVAFIMTAGHNCTHADGSIPSDVTYVRSRFVAFDYHGRMHRAVVYFTVRPQKADLCILVVKDLQLDIPVAELADYIPAVGEIVYNVSAPRMYFVPDMATIFMGIYSGRDLDGKVIATVPTAPGSSGSFLADSRGKVFGVVTGLPLRQEFDPSKHVWSDMRIVESIAIAEPLEELKQAMASVTTMDDVFGLEALPAIPTSSTSTVSES